MRSDDFIRFFGALRNRVANVILYNDRQVRDIKAMCLNRDIGSVFSFDKTFNLGAICNCLRVQECCVASKMHRRPSTVSGADFFTVIQKR